MADMSLPLVDFLAGSFGQDINAGLGQGEGAPAPWESMGSGLFRRPSGSGEGISGFEERWMPARFNQGMQIEDWLQSSGVPDVQTALNRAFPTSTPPIFDQGTGRVSFKQDYGGDALGPVVLALLASGVGAAASAGLGVGAEGLSAVGGAEGLAAGGGPLMPPAGMPPAIPGMEQAPFLSASGAPAFQYGTPEALSSSFGLSAAPSFNGIDIPSGGSDFLSQASQLFNGNSGNMAEEIANLTSTNFGGSGFLSNAGGSSGPMEIWEQLKKKLFPGMGNASNLFGIASGLVGLKNSNDMRKMAQQAMDPRVTDMLGMGARAPYLQQLQALMGNPGSINNTPGYKAGLDAVERKMASQGYLGSGNMMTALHKYGGDFFGNEIARLSKLAGFDINPVVTGGPGAAAALAGAGSNTLSAALASLGYTLRGMEKR